MSEKEYFNVADIFGENVFNDAVMQERLPKKIYKKLHEVMEEGKELDLATADVIAHEMKEWAIEKGATHYTHWFQPLTGVTAEKIIEDMKPEAVKRIQSRLVLEAVVKAEGLTASEEEFQDELNKMAEQYKMEIEKVKEFMGEYEEKQIKEDIAIQKAVDVIVNSVVEK